MSLIFTWQNYITQYFFRQPRVSCIFRAVEAVKTLKLKAKVLGGKKTGASADFSVLCQSKPPRFRISRPKPHAPLGRYEISTSVLSVLVMEIKIGLGELNIKQLCWKMIASNNGKNSIVHCLSCIQINTFRYRPNPISSYY